MVEQIDCQRELLLAVLQNVGSRRMLPAWKLKVRSHEACCNPVSMHIQHMNAHRMRIDCVHMAQQVSRLKVNFGERGCHK